MTTHTHTVPEWLTDDRVGTIVSPAEAAELPRGTYVVHNLTEVYRVSAAGGTRYPLSTDPASRRINMFGLALDAALKVVSVPGLRVDRRCLDALPEGAVVTNRDGDLWSAVEVDGARGWVCTFDREGNRRVGTPSTAYSSAALLAAYGPVVGSGFVPGFYPAPTVVGGLYTTPTEDADGDLHTTPDADRFDDPDTADNSLDLDDLYRAKPPTIVVDSDGDLWRRQVTGEGARVWVLVVENGVARPLDTPAAAATSERLHRLFGPIAYAPAEDVKAALAMIPRDVESARGVPDPAPTEPEHALDEYDTYRDRRVAHEWAASIDPDMSCWNDRERAAARYILAAMDAEDAPAVDPEHALDEYDADLDPDAVVEAALNRARVALTGEGEHVVVSITRDSDGRVSARTEVTEQAGEQL